jgi:alanine dehydrogenase
MPMIEFESFSSSSFSLQTQEAILEVSKKSKNLFIGVPKDTSQNENRVPITPSSVKFLINNGNKVVIETGAGAKSNFTDSDYSEAGARIIYDKAEIFNAEIILKVAPLSAEELKLLKHEQIIFSPIQLPTLKQEYINTLREKKVTAIALEYIKDESNAYTVVRAMSEIVGSTAILKAAELLADNVTGQGVLLGGLSGIPPVRVVILGAGVVSEYAARTALGLGALIKIFDNNIYKMMRLQNHISRRIFTSVIDPEILKDELSKTDVLIAALHSKTGRPLQIVSEDMVMCMKPKSVIIDVSIDQGGNVETSRVTNHDKPTFVMHDVVHYCVPNIASAVPRTASMAFSNILTPLVTEIKNLAGLENLLNLKSGIRHGVYVYKGILTNPYIGEKFNIKNTNIDLLLTTSRF